MDFIGSSALRYKVRGGVDDESPAQRYRQTNSRKIRQTAAMLVAEEGTRHDSFLFWTPEVAAELHRGFCAGHALKATLASGASTTSLKIHESDFATETNRQIQESKIAASAEDSALPSTNFKPNTTIVSDNQCNASPL